MSLLLKVPEDVHDEIFLKLPAKSILEYGVKESWIKKYTATSTQLPSRITFWKPLWSFENGKVLVEYCLKNLLLCVQSNERVESVVVGVADMFNNRETYVESIVSLGSGTYLEKRITDGNVMNPDYITTLLNDE
ncbi:hypothetical protein C5167_000166, partial [Papaver somniferum]